MNKKRLLSALTALLTAALLLTSCPNDDPQDDEEGEDGANVVLPFNWISVHPTSADYVGANPAIMALKVTANIDAGDTIAYQWYKAESFANKDGTAINGETNATFTPSASDIPEDGAFYYVTVTKTKTGGIVQAQNSNPARIRVLTSAPEDPATTVTISSTNAQYVRGFGGMSNAFGIGSPARYMQMKDIDTMFNPENGLGFNILRIMIWPDPLEEVVKGQVEPQMNNQTTYIQAVKKVNEYGGYVLASPWTPPPEWKENQSPNGEGASNLLPQYYGMYADYLAKYAQDMAAYGSPIYTISIQNEPSWPAKYAGCSWSSAQQRDFFTNASVGKFTEGVKGYGGGKETSFVKIMSAEPHQYVTWNDAARTNATAHGLIDIYAFHTYGNHSNSYTAVQADNESNRKEVWMTEWNINSGEGNFLQDSTWDKIWVFVDAVDNDVRCDSVNAYVWWYAKRFYGFIGDNSNGTVNNDVLPRGYALSHYAKYATDTVRVPAAVDGHPGGGNASDNNASTGYNSKTVNVKASAFRRKPKASRTGHWENQVKADENSISLVIYDKRTNAGAAEQVIRVNLPDDFGAAASAHAIISDSSGKRLAPHIVVLTTNGTTADFVLPANSIVSVKFSK